MNDNHPQTTIDEVHEIMYLLRGTNATKDGDYRNIHLGTVLEYLRNQKFEDKMITLQKLSLMLGLAQRQVRENYIDGLIAFGIISLNSDCKAWYWVGSKAIKNQFGKLRTNTKEDNEFVVSELIKKETDESATEYMNKKEAEKKNVN
jgi:hypothetical protein